MKESPYSTSIPQSVMLRVEATSSGGQKGRGTASGWPLRRARASKSIPEGRKVSDRNTHGDTSVMPILRIGQFAPQPNASTTSNARLAAPSPADFRDAGSVCKCGVQGGDDRVEFGFRDDQWRK